MNGSLLALSAAMTGYLLLLLIVLLYRDGPDRMVAEISGGAENKAVIRLEVANTGWKKMRGLMHRRTLAQDAGMLFSFRFIRHPVFWMKHTPIPLDILFIAGDGAVVEVHEDRPALSTERIAPRTACRHVIEVNGGFCRIHGILAGDWVVLREASPAATTGT
jgi:uncharacterized membrane protein (UPF0127 family)